MSTKKTFLLGVGCQKGGTSWLYSYLKDHPHVAAGYAKEYHAFDVRFVEYFRNFHDRRIAIQRTRFEKLKQIGEEAHSDEIAFLATHLESCARSKALSTNLSDYVAYFRSIADADDSKTLVCDITPSYCAIPTESWHEIRHLLESGGFSVRIIFLLRDPIERVYSAYRMGVRHTAENLGLNTQLDRLAPLRARARRGLKGASQRLRQGLATSPERKAAANEFLTFALEGMNLLRSQYDKTIRAIEAVFPPEDIKYLFYEGLFTDATIRDLTDFLAIDFVPGDYGAKINSSPGQRGMTDFERRYLRERLKDTYSFCENRFGRAELGQIWHNI